MRRQGQCSKQVMQGMDCVEWKGGGRVRESEIERERRGGEGMYPAGREKE